MLQKRAQEAFEVEALAAIELLKNAEEPETRRADISPRMSFLWLVGPHRIASLGTRPAKGEGQKWRRKGRRQED